MYEPAITLENDTPAQTLDASSTITLNLITSLLHNEIMAILNNSDCINACLRSATIKKFVERMHSSHYNLISTRSDIVQELFILNQTCKMFYHYNSIYLNLSHQEFRAKVLYPNIIYMLIRCLSKANKFLQTSIKAVYFEISRRSYGVIQKYAESYYLDHDVIKTDVLYEFLGNLVKKFDPLTIENIHYFYKQVFRNIFHFYFKKEQKFHTSYASMWDMDVSVSQLINTPARLSIYRNVLYKLQIEQFCKKSPTLQQITYNYNIFKNVIIPNEFQNMYFSQSVDTFMLIDNQYKLLHIYNQETSKSQDDFLKQIQHLPLIYKLLKCVHIVNPKLKPYNEMLIKPDVLKVAVLEEMMIPFKNMFHSDHIYGILDKIASNFTDSILSGEYINLLTLSNIRINHISFIQQVRKFVNICIHGVMHDRTDVKPISRY